MFFLQTLGQLISNGDASDATSEFNESKNRYQDKIPCMFVCIMHIGAWGTCPSPIIILVKLKFAFQTHFPVEVYATNQKYVPSPMYDPGFPIQHLYTIVSHADNHSRVYLKPTATQGSDYINASFIHVKQDFLSDNFSTGSLTCIIIFKGQADCRPHKEGSYLEVSRRISSTLPVIVSFSFAAFRKYR